jgi:D-inositol-3-phosphate glycosyltransferase
VRRRKVLFVEPVGGHRGMHYYDFGLCGALSDLEVAPTLVTSDETAGHNPPDTFESRLLFREIFGDRTVAIRATNYLYALSQAARLARDGGFEIVHCHYFLIPPVDYLFLRALKAMGVKIVITAHDVMPFDASWYTHYTLRHIYNLADKIIVHAQDNKSRMCDQFNVQPSKVTVIHHGNYAPYVGGDRLPRQALRKQIGAEDFANVVLFFGQIKKVKGLDHLIRAFPRVLEHHPSTVLVVAGQAWKDDFSIYARLVSSLGLERNFVARIEHIPDDHVAAYFESADVVALPYLEVYQSGVLLMACSYGRPVVATAVGGMQEVIQDGLSGYLVPSGDEQRLAEAIIALLSDKDKAEEMGRRARQVMQERYSWQAAAHDTREVYSEVVGEVANSAVEP